MRAYLAIDIGASSGRHIVGWMEGDALRTQEVWRFPNGVAERDGHLIWDPEALLGHVKDGLRAAFARFPEIVSLSIDTWGVDYVLLRGQEAVTPCYAYRDSRTETAVEEVHQRMAFSELYRRTGCQFQPFNSIYQLWDDRRQGRLEGVTDLLMMPEYLLYRLTGVKCREYTNATTMGLVSAETGEFDPEILAALELPCDLFPPLSQPGTVLGPLLPEVAAEVDGSCQVLLCATHDTGSAVEGIPMEGEQLYISSGTWSLLGVKTPRPLTDAASQAANYSNEGGVGYNRYQKNIMGLWLVNELRRELCPELPFPAITAMAEASVCQTLVDANDPAFLAPDSMKAAFDRAAGGALRETGDYFRCACRSLAQSYRQAIEELEHNTGTQYSKLYIVGGGAKNPFLNRLTAEATGKEVIALPIEATALGNLRRQLLTDWNKTGKEI